MLIQIATHQPQMLSAIVKHTPIWVWGLLAALLWLGIWQMFPRSVGTRQVLLLPLAWRSSRLTVWPRLSGAAQAL